MGRNGNRYRFRSYYRIQLIVTQKTSRAAADMYVAAENTNE